MMIVGTLMFHQRLSCGDRERPRQPLNLVPFAKGKHVQHRPARPATRRGPWSFADATRYGSVCKWPIDKMPCSRSYFTGFVVVAVLLGAVLRSSHCLGEEVAGSLVDDDDEREVENQSDVVDVTASKHHDSSLADRKAASERALEEYAMEEYLYEWRPDKFGSHLGRSRVHRTKFADILNLICPARPAGPDKGRSVELHLHKFKRDEKNDLAISEDHDSVWRKTDVDKLIQEGLDPKKRTLVVMGGWLQPSNANWMKELRRAMDKLADENDGTAPYNLLVFDWSDYGSFTYSKSVSFVPHLGKVLANLLTQLIDRHGFQADLVHLVSYSLSTHIAGKAGRLLNESSGERVRQITAIDPTGVCFHSNEDTLFDREFGLRPSDAELVVARHYNMHQLGAGRPIGGVDIFVNGGVSQPKMYLTKLKWNKILGSLGISVGNHHRAVQHEAIGFERETDCHEVAYACSNYEDFKMGRCADCGSRNQTCMLASTIGNMVLNLNPSELNRKPHTQMHITTGLTQFCVHHYQILAKLKKSSHPKSVLAEFERGAFEFELDVHVVARPEHRRKRAGRIEFTQLLRLDQRIVQFPRQIKLKPSAAKLLGSLESVSIHFMSNIFADERKRNSVRYCPGSSGRAELVICR
jgi:pimeloyl-ACP methyl ester carboxylesterase